MYNRVWCWEHGYLDGEREVELHQSAAEDTQKVLKDGHSKRGLENIDLDTVDDHDADAAMRGYEEGEWGATVIHYSPNSKDKLVDKMKSNSNFAFNYWTTLVPHSVSYEQHAYVVRNVNWVLKRGLRTLRKHGAAFTLNGPPVFVN
jgi:hypothetical protein